MSDFLSDTARKISKTHDFNILFIGGWQMLIPHGDIVYSWCYYPNQHIVQRGWRILTPHDDKDDDYDGDDDSWSKTFEKIRPKLELFSWGFSIGHFGSRRQGESRRTTNLLAVAYDEKTIAPLRYLKIYCVCIRDWKKRQQKWRSIYARS